MQVEVPAEWSDVDGAPFTDDDGNAVADVRAASSLEDFIGTWTTPGMIFSASSDWASTTTVTDLLDGFVIQRGGPMRLRGS